MDGTVVNHALYTSEAFFQNAVEFRVVRDTLTKKWEDISTGSIEKFDDINLVESEDGTFNETVRQQNFCGNPVNSLTELYGVATTANAAFILFLQKLMDCLRLDPNYLRVAPLKGKERAAEKAKDDYDIRDPGYGERWLFDICRASLILETEDELMIVLSYLTQLHHGNCTSTASITCDANDDGPDVEVVRMKNRFKNPTPAGFRDVNLNIRIKLDSSVCIQSESHEDQFDAVRTVDNDARDFPLRGGSIFHVCELQLHCRAVKELSYELHSHKYYEYFRTYFRGSNDAIQHRLQLIDTIFESLHRPDGAALARQVDLGAVVSDIILSGDRKKLYALQALLELTDERQFDVMVRRKLVEINETEYGPDDLNTLSAINNLGMLVFNMNDYEEARALYSRARRGFETAVGPTHSSTLAAVNNLAVLMMTTGDYEGSRLLYEQALQDQESALGPDHIDTLGIANNLAMLLADLNDFEGARALYQRVLNGKENALGPDHIDTLSSAANFANLLQLLNDFEGARALYQRALLGREKSLGPDHTMTLSTVNNLAVLLMIMGDHEGAEGLFGRALLGYEQVLGPDHTTTLGTVNNFAKFLQGINKYEEAEPLYMRALQGRELVLGCDHADTLATAYNLADMFFDMKDYVRARPLFERALTGWDVALGPDHTNSLSTANNLACLLTALEDHAGAKTLHERAWQGWQRVVGPHHSYALDTLGFLALSLDRLGRQDDARSLLENTVRTFNEATRPAAGGGEVEGEAVAEEGGRCQQEDDGGKDECVGHIAAMMKFLESQAAAIDLPSDLRNLCYHEHPIVKVPFIYRGWYDCNICSTVGLGLAYHCLDCGFDAHPQCLLGPLNPLP